MAVLDGELDTNTWLDGLHTIFDNLTIPAHCNLSALQNYATHHAPIYEQMNIFRPSARCQKATKKRILSAGQRAVTAPCRGAAGRAARTATGDLNCALKQMSETWAQFITKSASCAPSSVLCLIFGPT